MKQLVIVLGTAGLAPFIGLAVISVSGVDLFSFEARFGFASYSVVILSFLSGTVWGRLLAQSFNWKAALLLVVSNVTALIAWSSILVFDWRLGVSLTLLILGYLSIFCLELVEIEVLYKDVFRGYLKLRCWLTALVVGLHLVLLGHSILTGI